MKLLEAQCTVLQVSPSEGRHHAKVHQIDYQCLHTKDVDLHKSRAPDTYTVHPVKIQNRHFCPDIYAKRPASFLCEVDPDERYARKNGSVTDDGVDVDFDSSVVDGISFRDRRCSDVSTDLEMMVAQRRGSENDAVSIGSAESRSSGFASSDSYREDSSPSPPTAECGGSEPSQESLQMERRKSLFQYITEVCSLIIFCIGLTAAIASPFLIIPIFVFPSDLTPYFKTALCVTGVVSFLMLFVGAMIGNAIWYYDETNGKWRIRLHCGKGPKDHCWGNGIVAYRAIKQQQQQQTV